MKANVLTLFPEMFPGILGHSLTGKALASNQWHLNVVNIREFANDKYGTVDDSPFGGGAGMVMKVDVLDKALSNTYQTGPLIYFSPRGKRLTQSRVETLAKEKEITLICGHFEGVDERIFSLWNIEEVSIGDYILSGGEGAAQILLDSVIRLIPNVLGNPESIKEESFYNSLLEYPQYTRPQSYKGQEVPEVLTSGHHKKIKDWQKEQALKITQERRPDLYETYKQNIKERINK